MVILSTLPSELIAEVATHLDYHDAQKLRLACHRIDKAIQHIALSRLKLQLPQTPYIGLQLRSPPHH
ncbi:hypothetical protein BJ165DRAFT_1030635 [Panaeolus papilionaceus]|nr:hypothetical protein BJ165DRAFT_1030635 [Panaeolus papilionaceus]